ncbi:uncharacterized protein LOC115597751 isoform X1 [Sparus aurata]|uniref:uncharacterized protein LOC115597751 isoform X1 n=1 Tax=Sparus aurata TaxID=8175 RepID=UPI0011C0ECD4|nr:uncharacterized protein LOC115597751 isoform X1 [Sparus aurata]
MLQIITVLLLTSCRQRTRFTRLNARLQCLREHHDKCLSRHMEREKQQTQPSGGPNQEGKSSSLPELPSEPFADSKSLDISQDSESNTEILTPESSHSGVAEDPDVPPLRRTDSILITKEYLESIAKVSSGSESSINVIDSTCGSSSEGSYDLTSNAPMVKLKKQKTLQRTSKRKTLSCISSDEDNWGAESGNIDTTKMGKVKKKKTSHRTSRRKTWPGTSSGEESENTNNTNMGKVKKQKTSQRTSRRKTWPGTSLQGHSLKKIADIVQGVEEMTESDNKEFLKNLERSGRCEKKWDVCVLSRALKTLKEPTRSLDQIQIDPDEEVLEAVDSDLSQTEADSSFCSSLPGSSRSKERQRPESDSGNPQTGPSTWKRKQETVESDSGDLKTENAKRRSWSFVEVHAVEKTLMNFINSGKVPGKSECIACIMASPEALKQRSWTAVKFYVKNRITAIQRKSAGTID